MNDLAEMPAAIFETHFNYRNIDNGVTAINGEYAIWLSFIRNNLPGPRLIFIKNVKEHLGKITFYIDCQQCRVTVHRAEITKQRKRRKVWVPLIFPGEPVIVQFKFNWHQCHCNIRRK